MGEHKTKPKAAAKTGSFSGYGGGPAPAKDTVTHHGHDGTHVLLIWDKPIQNLRLTVAQVEAHIEALLLSKAKLLEHLAKFPAGTQQERPLGPGSNTPQ